jgi:hypothetical protein
MAIKMDLGGIRWGGVVWSELIWLTIEKSGGKETLSSIKY